MKKVLITYDPYTMKSKVLVDGKAIEKNRHCDPNLKKYLEADVPMPIQAWIEPRDSWEGLLEVLCAIDHEMEIDFWGRRIDYEGIRASLIAQNERRRLGAKLKFCELEKETISDSEMKKRIDEVVHFMYTDKFQKIVNDSESEELKKKYARLKETYEQIDEEEFRIVFTGTYSSGKSSTINALIGKNLLPTSNNTCTAKICKIIHDKKVKPLARVYYKYHDKIEKFSCVNEEEVQEKIRSAGDFVEGIEVYTDLSFVYSQEISSDFKLVIVDTPGTDSAVGNDTEKSSEAAQRLLKKSHLVITKEVLQSKQKEMVVFVSGKEFEGKNIVDLLDLIEESAENDKGIFNDRFLFVMNKCDDISYNERESLEDNVKKFIANITKVPNSSRNRKIVSPRVFSISSGAASAVVNNYVTRPDVKDRQTKKAELYKHYKSLCEAIYNYTPQELENDFEQSIEDNRDINYCLEEQSSVSEATKYGYEQRLKGTLSLPERLLIHSGVPAFKSAIQEYIKSYAYPIKVRELLGCFTDILGELSSLNSVKRKVLEETKKSYNDAVLSGEKRKKEKEEAEHRKKTLIGIKRKMDSIKKEIDKIKDTVPEINELRSHYYTMKNDIAENLEGKKEFLKEQGEQVLDMISKKVDGLTTKIEETVRSVKKNKKEDTEELYHSFLSYIEELQKEGLMENGSFSMKDTVAYKKILDKESFGQPEEETREEKNPKKYHIEFAYGIGNFFDSIARAWETRKEPDTVENTYLNIEKYIADNIYPMDAEIDKYVEQLKKDYKNDIDLLKEEAKKRVDQIFMLINEKDAYISKVKEEALSHASDEKKYCEQIKKIEKVGQYLDSLISKIEDTKVSGRGVANGV